VQPRIHVITLAVDDLERGVTFCRDGLGPPTDGIIGTEFLDDDEHRGRSCGTRAFHSPDPSRSRSNPI
jgi:catechol 2,3-dioxygenase-like lactoylglutathione lyase family enzyme